MIDPRLTAEVEIEIPFHDVDSIQMVWHGNHIKYFEIARTHLIRRFNYDMDEMAQSGIMWPVIECKCRYIQAISYGMIIVAKAWVTEVEHRLKINYLITEKSSQRRLAKGHTVQAAVDVATGNLMDTEVLQQRIEKYLKTES